MAKIAQTVEYSQSEVTAILLDHAKKDLTEAGGKQLQGAGKVQFVYDRENSSKTDITAVVSFERAGK